MYDGEQHWPLNVVIIRESYRNSVDMIDNMQLLWHTQGYFQSHGGDTGLLSLVCAKYCKLESDWWITEADYKVGTEGAPKGSWTDLVTC